MLQRKKCQNLTFRLDRREIDQRARVIEHTLISLDMSSSMSNNTNAKSAYELVQSLSDSINEFIATTNSTLGAAVDGASVDLNGELNRLSDVARILIKAAEEFACEPHLESRRAHMDTSARLLLNSLARILAIADFVDSYSISPLIEAITQNLRSMSADTRLEEFLPAFKIYSDDLKALINLCSTAIQNITDQNMKNDLASSLGQLAKQSLFLYTSTKTFLKYSNMNAAVSLRDQVYKESFDCIHKIHEIFSNEYKPDLAHSRQFTIGLIDKLNNLEKQVIELNSNEPNEVKKRKKLENQVEEVIKSINAFISKDLIMSERKTRVVEGTNTMKISLQALFDSYADKTRIKMIENIQTEFVKITKSVKRQLRKAVIEKMSTMTHKAFDDLLRNEVDQAVVTNFENHAKLWSDLSQMSCTMSLNHEGIKFVKMARKQLDGLVSYVVASAHIYSSVLGSSDSKEANENMQVIRLRWINQIDLLQLAIDDITCINDFLGTFKSHLQDR